MLTLKKTYLHHAPTARPPLPPRQTPEAPGLALGVEEVETHRDVATTAAVTSNPASTTGDQLNFVWRFVRNLAEITVPILHLACKDF